MKRIFSKDWMAELMPNGTTVEVEISVSVDAEKVAHNLAELISAKCVGCEVGDTGAKVQDAYVRDKTIVLQVHVPAEDVFE